MAFAFYSPFTIATGQVPSTETDFPVLLLPTDNRFRTVANGGHGTDASGYGLRPHANSALSSALTYELVPGTYNASTGAFEMHVKVPSLADGYVIYLGYGDAAITTDGSSTGAWNSAYAAVYHLGNGTSMSLNDSTSNGRHLDDVHSSIAAGTGKIAGGTEKLDGTGEFLQYMNWPITAGQSITVSFWHYQLTADLKAACGFNIGNGKVALYSCYSNKVIYWDYSNSPGSGRVSGDYTPYLDQWSLIQCVFDSGTSLHRIYVQGATLASTTDATAPTSNENPAYLQIGTWANADIYQKAAYDEVRISTVARSANWNAAEFNNQSAPATFYTLGAEVAAGAGGGKPEPYYAQLRAA